MASVVSSRPGLRGMAAVGAGAAALLLAPTVLAFFSGGYFPEAQLWAALVVWIGVAAVMLVAPRPLPRSLPALLCLGGLAGLTLWTAISIAWAPVRDPALRDADRMLLYLGFLIGAAALLRERRAARAVEPLLAGGALVVSAYALATRLLPGVVPSEHGARAGDRLDQPLTYWNALGAVAAMGVVLAVRIASDPDRDPRLRAGAAAATPALSLALYLTLSRGALAAGAVGIAVVLALARDRATVRTALLVVGGGIVVVALATRFPAVNSVGPASGAREAQGAGGLAVLLAISALVGVLHARLWTGRPDPSDRVSGRRLALAMIASVALVVAALAVPSLDGDEETRTTAPNGELPRDATRLRTFKTNRVKYWDVALEGFADAPLQGTGARGFATLWLERRPISESARDAHSLEVETLAELGLVGLALLGVFVGGAVVAIVRLQRAGPAARSLSLGWAAAAAVFLVHSAVDWDWEMPAVSLVFLALAGAAVAAVEERAPV